MFRGREVTHPDYGRRLLVKLAEDVKDLGLVEMMPRMAGRFMTMVIGPLKNK
jgi:translation initiation factor IF-3